MRIGTNVLLQRRWIETSFQLTKIARVFCFGWMESKRERWTEKAETISKCLSRRKLSHPNDRSPYTLLTSNNFICATIDRMRHRRTHTPNAKLHCNGLDTLIAFVERTVCFYSCARFPLFFLAWPSLRSFFRFYSWLTQKFRSQLCISVGKHIS